MCLAMEDNNPGLLRHSGTLGSYARYSRFSLLHSSL